MRQDKGFTLIELMITVAIVAILARVAFPSYMAYAQRGKIIDVTTALGQYRIQLEQYFQDNRNYGTANSSCGVTAPTNQYATFTCTVGASTSTFSISATSIAGQLGAATGDFTYTLDETNTRSTTKFRGNSTSSACWLVRGDEC